MRRLFTCCLICFTLILHSEEVLNPLSPYLLPDTHPAKPRLDALFQKSRPQANLRTLKAAGFTPVGGGTSHLKVLIHRRLKGYVIKLYTDDNVHDTPWRHYLHRIQGAERIQAVIKEHQINRHFTVPRKWIYLIPPPANAGPYDCLLLAENVYPLDHTTSKLRYKNNLKLHKFHTLIHLIQATGFTDCLPSNMPFCMDGRIAFLDTQHWNCWPVSWHRLRPHLKPRHQDLLDQIIENVNKS